MRQEGKQVEKEKKRRQEMNVRKEKVKGIKQTRRQTDERKRKIICKTDERERERNYL